MRRRPVCSNPQSRVTRYCSNISNYTTSLASVKPLHPFQAIINDDTHFVRTLHLQLDIIKKSSSQIDYGEIRNHVSYQIANIVFTRSSTKYPVFDQVSTHRVSSLSTFMKYNEDFVNISDDKERGAWWIQGYHNMEFKSSKHFKYLGVWIFYNKFSDEVEVINYINRLC